jgi:hypothetical protein
MALLFVIIYNSPLLIHHFITVHLLLQFKLQLIPRF